MRAGKNYHSFSKLQNRIRGEDVGKVTEQREK